MLKKISTEDGSDTLLVPELDETYHSIHGAIQESNHVFVKNGLAHVAASRNPEKINILEYGFGTGLNALLTLVHARGMKSIYYTSLEKYPVPEKIGLSLNYASLLQEDNLFKKIISSSWGNWAAITQDFQLRKIQCDFRDYKLDETYDLIYFDAFAPIKQPELWSVEILKVCYDSLDLGGVFVTYSAKGQLRRDLQDLGFSVERLPGPPGKFEMLRATK